MICREHGSADRIRPRRARWGPSGWRVLIGRRPPREDLAERAEEAGEDLLAGEDVVILQLGRRAVTAEDLRHAQLGIDDPDQGDAGPAVVTQFLLPLPSGMASRSSGV